MANELILSFGPHGEPRIWRSLTRRNLRAPSTTAERTFATIFTFRAKVGRLGLSTRQSPIQCLGDVGWYSALPLAIYSCYIIIINNLRALYQPTSSHKAVVGCSCLILVPKTANLCSNHAVIITTVTTQIKGNITRWLTWFGRRLASDRVFTCKPV